MADIAALPFFIATGNYRGIVPDTLDVGYRPDEFRPWGAVTITPLIASSDDKLRSETPELRLTTLTEPATVLLVPVSARIETGELRFGREPAASFDVAPPSTEQAAEQQAAAGVPLLANGDALELGTDKLVYRVEFGDLTILGHSYRFGSFYFLAPTVTPPQPWHLEVEGATAGTFTTTVTVGAGSPATTAAIAYNADNATVLAAFEALPNIAPGDLTITGTSLAAGLRLAFGGALAGQRVTLGTDATGLTGGAGVDTHELEGATVDLTTVTRWTPAT